MEAVERVRARLLRATAALEAGRVTYAVVGGNAVSAWIARVDREAVSFTQDVDILVRRSDFDAVRRALESAGFIYRHLRGVDVFLDGPEGRPRTGVHLIFAGEKVREEEPTANPDPSMAERAEERYFVLDLAALVQIKLTAFREKDRGHMCDFLELGLLDATWLDRLPPVLAERLKQLIDNPE